MGLLEMSVVWIGLGGYLNDKMEEAERLSLCKVNEALGSPRSTFGG